MILMLCHKICDNVSLISKKTRQKMIQKLYTWMLLKAQSKTAPKWLGAIAFAESSFFPLPPDILLIPMIIAKRAKAWWYAFLCSINSVIGGLAGYAIGYFLFDSIGTYIINAYSLQESFISFQEAFLKYGFWLILLKGLTPIPYKLVTIASGATGLSLIEFTIASIISRSARFYILSGTTWYFGDQAKEFMDKNFKLVSIGILAILILGFIAIKAFAQWSSF